MWLLVLAGCAGITDDWCARFNFDCDYAAAPERPEPIDEDGDVYAAGTDCDDANPDIHPSAEEVCDFIDNNCDGQIDEGFTHFHWYNDEDRDTHGSNTAAEVTCTDEAPAPELVDTTGDCDDTNRAIFPGALERCDFIDNDCDGLIDDEAVDSLWLYLDADLDNHGDADQFSYRCEAEGWVPVDDDCDDSNAKTYPGAAELADGLDNRCDGLLDTLTPTPLMAISAHEILSFAVLGDINQNGYTDIGVGLADDAYYVGLIEVDQIGGSLDFHGLRLHRSPTNDRPGAALLRVGDVTGDGYPDVLVGDDLNDANAASGGAVLLASGADFDLREPVAMLYSSTQNAYAGSAIGSGDFDGNGTTDYLVGAYKHGGQGAAWVVSGPISGNADLDDVADVRLDGEAGDSLGRAVSGAGDVDGDGRDDILIGANGAASAAGAAYLLFGGDTRSPDATFTGETESASAGFALTDAGDTNGDGYDDLLIGAHNTDGVGAAYIVFGDPTLSGTVPLASADAVLRGEMQGDRLGYTVSALGDVDGDLLDDIAVGAPGHSASVSDSGAQFMVFGSEAGGTVSTVGYHLETPNAELGDLPMHAVDVDHHGAAELLFAFAEGPELLGVQNH